jgi:hypothetical protein
MVADSGIYSGLACIYLILYAPAARAAGTCKCAISDGSCIFYAATTESSHMAQDSGFQQVDVDGSCGCL